MVNKDTKETMVSPYRMHHMYSGMAKGTSRAEVMLNNEKIKPITLAIVEVRESGRQAGRQAVENSIE